MVKGVVKVIARYEFVGRAAVNVYIYTYEFVGRALLSSSAQ